MAKLNELEQFKTFEDDPLEVKLLQEELQKKVLVLLIYLMNLM